MDCQTKTVHRKIDGFEFLNRLNSVDQIVRACNFACFAAYLWLYYRGKFIQVKLVYYLAETWKFKKIPVVTCVRKKVK